MRPITAAFALATVARAHEQFIVPKPCYERRQKCEDQLGTDFKLCSPVFNTCSDLCAVHFDMCTDEDNATEAACLEVYYQCMGDTDTMVDS